MVLQLPGETKRGTQESPRALQAFTAYLELPPPRDLSRLVGKRPTGRRGMLGKPYTLSTLQVWCAEHRWRQRAMAHDVEVATRIQQELVEWRAKEAIKREKARLAGHEIQRVMALELLTYPMDPNHPEFPRDNPKLAGRPRPMRAVELGYLDEAAKFLKQAGDGERLDLGLATERVERTGSGDTNIAVTVLGSDQLAELREMVARIPQVDPQLVIDGTVLPDGTIPAARQISDGADDSADADPPLEA